MLERFSRLASVAIYNARLYTDIQHELEQPHKQAEDDAKKWNIGCAALRKWKLSGTIAEELLMISTIF